MGKKTKGLFVSLGIVSVLTGTAALEDRGEDGQATQKDALVEGAKDSVADGLKTAWHSTGLGSAGNTIGLVCLAGMIAAATVRRQKLQANAGQRAR